MWSMVHGLATMLSYKTFLGTWKKIIDQRCDVYFVSDKEVSSAHSGLLVELADAVWRKIGKHTGLLFFWLCLRASIYFFITWLITIIILVINNINYNIIL